MGIQVGDVTALDWNVTASDIPGPAA